jgi:bifunctional non-homologous end joining protein LigD
MGGATTRDHRLPKDVRRTRAASSRAATADVIAGIRISHPDRVIYRDLGISKLDVARYYDAVAEWMLPHVVGRPLTLLRCGRAIDPSAEKGGCVMMRHGKAWGPTALRRVRIRELRKVGEYLVADTREALVALAQMGVLEIHTWNADADEPYLHDRVILDLDPGAAIAWNAIVGAAKLIRKALTAVGLASWVKTTGGKGLHVVAPVERAPYEACLAFAQTTAAALVQHDPGLFTTDMRKEGREDKILIDALRNNRTNTAVAAYSLRARAGAPVSFPIAWGDLSARLDPTRFNVRTVADRLRRDGDAWDGYASARQALPGG